MKLAVFFGVAAILATTVAFHMYGGFREWRDLDVFDTIINIALVWLNTSAVVISCDGGLSLHGALGAKRRWMLVVVVVELSFFGAMLYVGRPSWVTIIFAISGVAILLAIWRFAPWQAAAALSEHTAGEKTI